METGFLNLHDEEHFGTLPSPFYDQDILEDSDGSLLDMIRDEFPSYEVSVTRSFDAPDIWDTEQELNGDMAVLPLAMPLDGSFPKMEPHTKEDFQKMLTDWQEHLGSLQASDSEDMDVKDIVGMDMVMPKHISEHLPDNIFEDETKSVILPRMHDSPVKKESRSLTLDASVKNELQFNLDNFMDCEEGDDVGLTVAEDEAGSGTAEDTAPNVKNEIDEDCIDVETVSEQMPVLEAGDLKSLLEQFEASEAFNTNSNSKPSVLDTHLYAMATQQLTPKPPQHLATTPAPTTPKGSSSILSHQNIKDSLPKEVIDRIKASGRKKAIPVIPAMPSRRPGRGGTRMQDAGAALSRNKLLKIVSGGGGGESVQLDHDYCTLATSDMDVAPPPRSFYHSDASEYVTDQIGGQKESNEGKDGDGRKCDEDEERMYSRLPEYYMVLAPQKLMDKNEAKSRKVTVRDDESWGESNSKKDSGLESGEVSDASEETLASPRETVQHCSSSNSSSISSKGIVGDHIGKKPVTFKTSKTSLLSINGNCNNVLSVNGKDYHIASSVNSGMLASSNTDSAKPGKEMTMISVLKKCHIGNVSNTSGKPILNLSDSVNSESSTTASEFKTVKEEQQGPKKRKLNLEEYRNRVKELDRIRGSRESSRANSPVPLLSCSTSVSVGTSMMEDASLVSKENADSSTPTAVTEETHSENNSSTTKDVTSVATGSTSQPTMQSVEVQTIPEEEVAANCDAGKQDNEKEVRDGRSRDRRRRQYRSRRESSSSSTGSSFSSNSRNSRRRHRNSRTRHRHRNSWRRSSVGRSNSSSGSRCRSIWSRSPSSDSCSSSCSSCSRSRSHSRSRSRSSGTRSSRRSPLGSGRRWRRQSYDRRGRDYRRSRSPLRNNWKTMPGEWHMNQREKQRQVEERRVIYVGRIEEGTSKAELRRRFEVFGPIIDISVHFRERGDNYGFVTFGYKVDAYEAVEHGNDDPNLPHYDLCFGGRRAFCKTKYSDLDGMATKNDPLADPSAYVRGEITRNRSQNEDSFDLLLREAQAKLRKRKA